MGLVITFKNFKYLKHSGFRLFLIFLFLSSSICFAKIYAQKIIQIPDPELDSSYVEVDYKQWSIRAFSAFWYHNLILKNNNNGRIAYYPTSPFSLGIGFSYRFLVIDIGFRFTREFESTRFDFQSQFVFKNNLFDVIFQDYTGFQRRRKGDPIEFRDDIKSNIITFNHFFIVNHKKISMSSALSGNRIQRKSAGTLLLGSFLSYNRIKADSTLIPNETNGDFDELAQIVDAQTFNFGAYIGYAYNWVLPKGFFIFSSITPGIGVNIGKVKSMDTYSPPFFPTWKLYGRVSFGKVFNNSYLILGMTSNLTLFQLTDANSYQHNAGQIKLVYGYRFKKQNKITETIDKTF